MTPQDSLWRRLQTVVFASLPPSGSPPELGISLTPPRVQQAGQHVSAAPKILLLTSGLGHGHTRAAQALRLALLQQSPGATVTILDWWSLLHEDVAATIKKMYLQVVQQHPALYEQLYQLDEMTWRNMVDRHAAVPPACVQLLELIEKMYVELAPNMPTRGRHAADRAVFSLLCSGYTERSASLAAGLRARMALLKWNWSRLVRRLGNYIDTMVPDAIISTQMIPGALVSAVKKQRRFAITSVAVLTDFGVHDFWHQSGTDLYCVGHESLLGAAWLTERQRVSATGFALMPQFSSLPTQQAARRELGLNPQQPMVLVLGGGLGLGLEGVAQALLDAELPARLLVLCGQNVTTSTQLTRLSRHRPDALQVVNWTDKVALYMCAADVVVGKPGGLSVAEALACGRPFLATRSLGGQEGFNARFIQQFGVGSLLNDAQLVDKLCHLLQHPDELAALQLRAAQLLQRDGAAHIANQVLARISDRVSRHKESTPWRQERDS